MKQFGLFSLLIFFLACGGPDEIPWGSDLEAALQRSESKDLPLVTYFHTDWCTYCRQMEATTFQDPDVIEHLAREYVLVKLNAEKDEQGIRLREKFEVTAYPTFLLMTPSGEEIDRVQGYLPPESFTSALQERLEDPNAFLHVREQAEQNPADPTPQFELARKYLERGQTGRASRQLMSVIELDPENRAGHSDDSLYRLAEILAAQSEPADALLAVKSLRQRYPDSPVLANASLLEAELLIEKGEREKALAILRDFLKEYPEHESISRVRNYLDRSSPVSPARSH